MGFIGRDTPGANAYFMFARQVQQGRNWMQNYYTSEPLPGHYFHFEWWAFGKFARWTGLSLIATFHLGRIAGVFLFLIAVYLLAAASLPTVRQRRLAVALICLGSGLGWAIWAINHGAALSLPLPRDLKGVSVPGHLINKPHFIRAGIFAALQYAFLLLGERTQRRRYFLASGCAAAAQSMIRPFHIPETYLVYALFPVLRWIQEQRFDRRRFENYALAAAVHTPMLLWHGYVFLTNPLGLSPWKRQADMLLMQLLWMGIPFLLISLQFAIKGLSHIPKAGLVPLLLGLWLGAAFAVVNLTPYLAWTQESHYAYVLVPPILAVAGPLPWLYRALCASPRLWARLPFPINTDRCKRAAALVLLAISMPTTAIVYAQFFTHLHHPPAWQPWRYYISDGFYGGIQWLGTHADRGSVVLASHPASQFIPRFVDNKIVLAQDVITANFNTKLGQVKRFFQGDGDEAFKRSILERYHVDYVIYGDLERQLGSVDLDRFTWLRPVYRAGDVTLYRVLRNGVR